MGSYALSNPTDNRLAVTDDAWGMTSSISGNNSSLGYAPNSGIRTAKDVSYLESGAVLLSGQVGHGSSVSVLDGGAIGGALQFADNSLSKVISTLIAGQNANAAAAGQQAATWGEALKTATASSAATLADMAGSLGQSFTDAAGSLSQAIQGAILGNAQAAQAAPASGGESQGSIGAESGKRALMIGAALGLAWWLFKRRRGAK